MNNGTDNENMKNIGSADKPAEMNNAQPEGEKLPEVAACEPAEAAEFTPLATPVTAPSAAPSVTPSATPSVTPEFNAPQKPKKEHNKLKYGSVSIVTTVVFLAIIIVLNIVVGILTERFPSMNVDLTQDKLNTLSENSLDIAKNVTEPTELYILADEDRARSDSIFSEYGIKYSQVANLTDKIREANSNIEVSFLDPDKNPTFVSDYPDDNLTTGKILVRTDRRYKVLSISDLYNISQNSETGAYEYYSLVDGALGNALHLVNLESVPVFSIATGHNEMLSTAMEGFKSDLISMSFEVKEFNVLTEEIPENTSVLMLATPSTDYTREEIEKLREYLANPNGESRTLMLTCYPSQAAMPNLFELIEEWGVRLGEGYVVEGDTSQMISSDQSFLFANSTDEYMTSSTYNMLLSPYSTPLEVLFTSNDDIYVKKLWTSSDTSFVATSQVEGEQLVPDGPTSSQVLATLSTKDASGSGVGSNVLVFGSSFAFVDNYAANSTFSNKQYYKDLFSKLTGVEDSGITVQQVQTGKADITASNQTAFVLGLGVFTIALPLIILIVGLVVFFRRRHL